MSEHILETLIVTHNPDGSPHIAPMGARERDGRVLLAPFRPSRTLDNLLREGCASVNATDDVRIYAGCLSGRRDWPVVPCERIGGSRLAGALAHREVEVAEVLDHAQRPELLCRVVAEATHGAFMGFNRAQAAVLELAILASRLDMLPPEKIESEFEYLRIAIDKTAGPREREAWSWLVERVERHRARACA
jgi:uncharacterized protein